MTPDITQTQARDLLRPLFEYVGIDEQDVSVTTFTADHVAITHQTRYGSVTDHIPFTSIGD